MNTPFPPGNCEPAQASARNLNHSPVQKLLAKSLQNLLHLPMNQRDGDAMIARLHAQWRNSLQHFTPRRNLIANVPAPYGIHAFITSSIVAAPPGSWQHIAKLAGHCRFHHHCRQPRRLCCTRKLYQSRFSAGLPTGSLQQAADLWQPGNFVVSSQKPCSAVSLPPLPCRS
ncbi:MAG: hypothetical protein ONB48_16800 [candidate division KSB1 bacterium]|nr:hypothetical protein [candidate division KSB1 bacterium]MDZ7275138.1 hypothetical protein [candidate division KSB1 bacterium]MDZ7287308.1 hypothetical protein [candidate division KSB1 bacterium]MDZ7299422.1 hypothetical protein [candidate division KSB1 bacterium]MDZ7308061.1 hypothetical protein [candidate division KSB1 bacterium]